MHHASGISGIFIQIAVMEQRELCYFEDIQFPIKYISYPFLRDMKEK